MMKKSLFISLLLVSTGLYAQLAATVLSVSDQVTASHNGSNRVLSRGASLSAGDSITTSANGSATIKYTNGTLVNIGPGSNYAILAYSPNQKGVQIKAALNYGTIKAKTNGHVKETVKTPVIALAILGTSYELSVSCQPTKTKHIGKRAR